MSGDEPTIKSCATEGEEDRMVVEQAKKWMEIYNPDEICILTPTYDKMNRINAIFQFMNIKTDVLSGDEIPQANGVIKICTTSGVKGLEFSGVIISSFNKIGTQKQLYGSAPETLVNYEKLVECEKYVAITRARDKVFITYVGD